MNTQKSMIWHWNVSCEPIRGYTPLRFTLDVRNTGHDAYVSGIQSKVWHVFGHTIVLTCIWPVKKVATA